MSGKSKPVSELTCVQREKRRATVRASHKKNKSKYTKKHSAWLKKNAKQTREKSNATRSALRGRRKEMTREKDTAAAQESRRNGMSSISAAELEMPTYTVRRTGQRPQRENLRREAQSLGLRHEVDPIAAENPPLKKRRSPRDTAMLEAVAKMYGTNATYEQIADRILTDFDVSEGAPE